MATSSSSEGRRVALYARVSRPEQHCETQLRELRRYCAARAWVVVQEYADRAGGTVRRRGLAALRRAAKTGQFDVVLCWRLDRLGRGFSQLVRLAEELEGRGVALVTLEEGIDLATVAGRLHFHILAALAEFERGRTRERVRAGLARVQASGRRLGRPPVQPTLIDARLRTVVGLSLRAAARQLGVSRSTVHYWRAKRAGV